MERRSPRERGRVGTGVERAEGRREGGRGVRIIESVERDREGDERAGATRRDETRRAHHCSSSPSASAMRFGTRRQISQESHWTHWSDVSGDRSARSASEYVDGAMMPMDERGAVFPP